MPANVQSGLLMVGAAAFLLYAWWSGGLTYFLAQLTGKAGAA